MDGCRYGVIGDASRRGGWECKKGEGRAYGIGSLLGR